MVIYNSFQARSYCRVVADNSFFVVVQWTRIIIMTVSDNDTNDDDCV